MPCQYEPGPEDHYRTEREKNINLTERLDKATAENDRLREAVLLLIKDREADLHPDVVEIIEHDQQAHRREDLNRLEKTFRDNIFNSINNEEMKMWMQRLGAVVVADISKPLEPQLGFDPDDF